MGIHLGGVGSFSHIFLHFWKRACDSRVAFLACTFPCPYFGYESKAKVVTVQSDLFCIKTSCLMYNMIRECKWNVGKLSFYVKSNILRWNYQI